MESFEEFKQRMVAENPKYARTSDAYLWQMYQDLPSVQPSGDGATLQVQAIGQFEQRFFGKNPVYARASRSYLHRLYKRHQGTRPGPPPVVIGLNVFAGLLILFAIIGGLMLFTEGAISTSLTTLFGGFISSAVLFGLAALVERVHWIHESMLLVVEETLSKPLKQPDSDTEESS